jgi:deoxyribodipyrimidine photo-lyase
MSKPTEPRTAADRPVVVWLRDDLRVADNPALAAAAESGAPVFVLYVLDEASEGIRPLGGAARWWLAGSLASLADSLAALGVPLVLRRGPAGEVVPSVVREAKAAAVFWNRRYGGGEVAVDRALKARLTADGVTVKSFQASLLYEPWAVRSGEDRPYRVFSPFWRAARATGEPRRPLPAPAEIKGLGGRVASEALADWRLTPTRPDWAGGLRESWEPGEAGAERRLAAFLDGALARYADDRDVPAGTTTSMLSPHLRFGDISPFRVWHAAAARAADGGRMVRAVEKFHSELGWREFAWHLLHHAPDLASRNFQPRFDAFPWDAGGGKAVEAWRRGCTGVPIVDAGMRQLWTTGWMHNRIRMVVASFLVKHLLVDWRVGEAWFWDTLVDADQANNPASWQWVAGTGADAAPYVRVFNPVLQGEKFDADGSYVRQWVPELARLPDAWLHKPWEAPADVLAEAGVRLGRDYPKPVIALVDGRARALAAFERIRAAA